MGKPHYKLDVWNKGIDLVLEIYRITSKFPDGEKFGLIAQMRRSVVSIPSNIAEGTARNTKKEFNNFLSIAQGSASELETQLIITNKLDYIDKKDLDSIIEKVTDISKMINGLKRSLRES